MTINSKIKTFWLKDFQGMNQRQDMDKIGDNQSWLLRNVSLDKPGTWSKRKGSRICATSEGGEITGGITYFKNDGTTVLRAVRSTNLCTYDPTANTWTTIQTGTFTAGSKVQMVNYLNRVYSISPSDFLSYETGGAGTKVVDSDTNGIKGNTIAVAQNTLFVGGVNAIGAGSVAYQDRVYYTVYDLTNNVSTNNFWDSGKTFSNSVRFFSTIKPVTALFSYSNMLYAFTETTCYTFDMRYESNALGVQKVFDIGCANPRAVCEVNGQLVWMSPDARIWSYVPGNAPQNISWILQDDENGEAIINRIPFNTITDVSCGSYKNTVYFSIGAITYLNDNFDGQYCVLKGLFTENNASILWSMDTYSQKPSLFIDGRENGEVVKYFCAYLTKDVYKMNYGVNDGTQTIQSPVTTKCRTKFFDFETPYETKEGDEILVKFRPQTANPCILTVSYALDGSLTYIPITSPTLTTYGKIDMYSTTAGSQLDGYALIKFPPSINFRTLSLEISNAILNNDFEFSGLGINLTSRDLDVRLS